MLNTQNVKTGGSGALTSCIYELSYAVWGKQTFSINYTHIEAQSKSYIYNSFPFSYFKQKIHNLI